MADGYAGKIGFVDLTTGEIQTETLDKGLAREFIGGQGIGARILFERQKKGVDPLGPESMLGFTTGPLTATGAAWPQAMIPFKKDMPRYCSPGY